MEICPGAVLLLLLFSGTFVAIPAVVAARAGTKRFTFSGTGTVENGENGSSGPHPGELPLKPLKARDCSDIKAGNSSAQDGVYTITPSVGSGSIQVYCDMTNNGGGWTVIQRRTDGSEDFIRTWDDYKEGFGSLENEFWLGNENIYRISNQHGYSIRFDLEDFTKGKRNALYYHFYIDGEDEKYRLHVHAYTGDAGEALLAKHNEMNFSTKDRDNDQHITDHCSQRFLGGWWYKDCHQVNLNGQYNNTGAAKGINWHPFTGYHTSLKRTTMKIRP